MPVARYIGPSESHFKQLCTAQKRRRSVNRTETKGEKVERAKDAKLRYGTSAFLTEFHE
jgi:hypothetical protein